MSFSTKNNITSQSIAFFYTPFWWFIVASSILFATHYQWDIIRWELYTGIHFYWGLVGILALGYWPFKINFIQLFQKEGGGLSDNIDFNWKWSFNAGVVMMLIFSISNEVFNDPDKNGVPFMEAWQHLAADLSGLALFCVLYFWYLNHPAKAS